MKKFIIVLSFTLFVVMGAFAQQKGDKFVGGAIDLGVTSVGVSGVSTTAVEFGIQPEIGFFVADKFMLGFNLGYALTSGDSTTHTLVIGTKLSYYIPVCEKFYYTPALELAYCNAFSGEASLPGFGAGLSLARFEYRATKQLALSASMLSLDYVLLAKNGLKVNTVNFGLSLSPSIGLRYYF